jgi:hypothetical protein
MDQVNERAIDGHAHRLIVGAELTDDATVAPLLDTASLRGYHGTRNLALPM